MPDQTAFAYDVFISYSHADEAVGERRSLLPRLEAAGLKVCIDCGTFCPGAPQRHRNGATPS